MTEFSEALVAGRRCHVRLKDRRFFLTRLSGGQLGWTGDVARACHFPNRDAALDEVNSTLSGRFVLLAS